MNELHLDECLTDAEKRLLQCKLVDVLMAKGVVCPACVHEILMDLANETSKLWIELNADELYHTHRH